MLARIKSGWQRQRKFMICILAFAGFTLTGKATELATAQESSPFPSGPYCGVYCVKRGLQAVGRDVEIETLIDPTYISSHKGSSLVELTQAVKDCGAAAIAVNGLTVEALQQSEHPIVLHVAGSALSHSFNHWVLFLGMENGKARIYDPPGALTTIPLARLISISDGIGLVIRPTDARDNETGLFGCPWRSIGVVLFGMAMVFVHRGFGRREHAHSLPRSPLWRIAVSTRNAALLVVIGFSAGFIHDLTNSQGLLHNPAAAAGVSNKFYPDRVPEASIEQLRQMIAGGQGTIVDARTVRAYAAGHILGAINLPVTGGLFGHRGELNNTGQSKPICVYCQNEQCLWARDVAFRLMADGYENVSVFSAGWQAWSRAEKDHE